MLLEKAKSILLPYFEGNKTIGFMISGGFDSGLLLYLCSLIKQQHNLPNFFYVFTVPRHDDSIIHAKRIVNWINNRFNTQIKILMVGDPDLHHSQQVANGVISAKHKCDLLLLAETTNPPHLPNGPDRIRIESTKIKQPFFDFTKKETVGLAIELGLNDLMSLSHTCTESKLLRCGTCWQCRERAWGFEQNNYSDPGTM